MVKTKTIFDKKNKIRSYFMQKKKCEKSVFQLLSLSVTCKKNCKVFFAYYLGLSIQIVQYLAPPLASEAGVPGVVSSARATSSESSASSRRTSSSTLRPLIEVSASMEAAVPIYLGIIDLIKVEKW